MAIKVATDATFEAEVLHNDKPVVVDFWAAWCGPCKLVAPEMEKIAEKYEGAIDVVKVDVDRAPGVASRYAARSIPTLLLLRDGREIGRQVGAVPAGQLRSWVGGVLDGGPAAPGGAR